MHNIIIIVIVIIISGKLDKNGEIWSIGLRETLTEKLNEKMHPCVVSVS